MSPDVADIPVSVTVTTVAAMLNFELADHRVYDGAELQWFDDPEHGTGMLAFLSRREGREVDYYVQHGLRLDREDYHIGGGTGSWTEIAFDAARLVVAEDGVHAEACFVDRDGRTVEIRVDDRDGRRRNHGGLLAPVSSGIDDPTSLLLVWMPAFDLVRKSKTAPTIRIDGEHAQVGRLPGAAIHRRHLIKYAAPLVSAKLNPTRGGVPCTASDDVDRQHDGDGRLIGLEARQGGHQAGLSLTPGMPPLDRLAEGAEEEGRWHTQVDGIRLTGGRWRISRGHDAVHCRMVIDEPWRPGRQPWLMRLVTRLIPVFRRWPLTYEWHCDIPLQPGLTPTARWQRTPGESGQGYRRATGS